MSEVRALVPSPFGRLANHKGTAGIRDEGTQYLFKFANGRGASVVQHGNAYGRADSDTWELAVISPDGELDYSTPVTGDVLAWRSVEEITQALNQIEGLAPHGAIDPGAIPGELL